MILEPLSQDDPRLRQRCAELTRAQLRMPAQQLEIDALVEFVYGKTALRDSHRDSGGLPIPSTVGLSANQVGIMKQICLVDLGIARPGYHDVRILINPQITWSSKTLVERVEGCVNFAEWWGVTRRPQRVKVTALDRSGFVNTIDVSGWAAAVICHEVDHLNGNLFIDRLKDPTRAHLVNDADYPEYRKGKAHAWPKVVDVSNEILPVAQ